jgi:uncharacterized membrane protein
LGYLAGLTPTQTGLFSDNATKAQAVNADGSLIVGTTGSGFQNPTSRAWRWTSASGMQDLNLFAANAGINLGGIVLTDAVGLSDNGQHITGNSFNAAQNKSLGYVLSIAAAPPAPSSALSFLAAPASSPSGCGTSQGGDTFASQISANGSIVAGYATAAPRCATLWTNGVGAVVPNGGNGLTTSADFGQVAGLSGDASVFTVMSRIPSAGPIDAFRAHYWTPTAQFQAFADPSANEVIFDGGYVNTDGTYFAVNSSSMEAALGGNPGDLTLGNARRAYRWSLAGGYESLGSFTGNDTLQAKGISGDGNIIVGQDFIPQTQNSARSRSVAFTWRPGSGLSQLPDLSSAPAGSSNSANSVALGISRDGSTIVGQSRGNDGFSQAVYWRGGTVTGLGFLSGATPTDVFFSSDNATSAQAASADGSVIVGFSFKNFGADRAWRWTAASGMQDLNLFAANAGINLDGFVLTDALDISDNGQYITGNSFNAAQSKSLGYVLSIAAAPPPPPTLLSTTARLIVTLTLPGVTQTSIVNQTFSTQVDAKLNGSNVFTRTVGDQITGSLGVTALADARTALQQTSGLRRVVIGAPVLVSNTTTVLSSSRNTVSVASGTQVTTAAVTTNGPATVATGDLGTCATAAANEVNPTGCSLPGTAVAVNANVINTNTFTNTINSVTPTTTTTVNQLVSAKWQVAATAGNQFGTVHALSGVAAFDRGDRLIGQLLRSGGGGQGENANRLTRAAMPVRDVSGLGGADSGLTMFGGYFGNWQHIDADPSVPVADVKGTTNGFVLGLEKRLGAGRVGVAVDHGTSDYTVRDSVYPETLSFKHTQVALFAGWQSGGFSLDGAAAYGFGTARTSLVTPTTPANASRDVRSWSLGAQAGYTVALGKSASVELVGGVRHVSADLKTFTETGGPSPLMGRDQTVHRTRAFAGIEAQAGIALGGVTLTPRIHARYAHDSGAASGAAELVFVSAPNAPAMTAVGPGVGRDVAELGGSLDAAVAGNLHVWAGYDGTFRRGAKMHAAKAGITVVW